MNAIAYRRGYKYQLAAPYTVSVNVYPPEEAAYNGVLSLKPDGMLRIAKGYAWDGPSGPTIDTPNFMRGSLVHDALYQLMRHRKIDPARWRAVADRELQRMCIEDGMSRLRAWYVYRGVRAGGNRAARDPRQDVVLWAP